MKKSQATLAILSLAAGTVFAGSALAQAKESGAYVGLSIGQSKADNDCDSGVSCDNKDTSWKIFGGYQFMRYLGAEVAYTDLGKSKANADIPGFASSNVDAKSHAWELVAVGSYPIGTSGFAPYIKAGFYYGQTEATVALNVTGLPSTTTTFKENHTDWTAGIGVRYDIGRNFAVRAEWQRYNGVGTGDSTVSLGGVSTSTGGDAAVDVISIGALYKF